MATQRKILAVLVLFILLVSVIIISFVFLNSDNKPPEITEITGDTNAAMGSVYTISAEFSDNVEVTKAKLYYRSSSEIDWRSKSILNGVAEISIPSDSEEDIYYYVTVDDAAGNGPIGSPSKDGKEYYVIDVVRELKLVSNVFVEEASTTWCKNCPQVAKVIHDSYKSDKNNFYYVSLVSDKNSFAENRLSNGFKTYGYPSVYLDGGFRFLVGGGSFESKFKKFLSESNSRSRPDVYVYLESVWDRKNKVLENTVEVVNKDNESYSGTVRVYICENKSVRWSDYDGNPYRHAFLEYGLEESVDLDPGENITLVEEWIPSESSFEDVSVENLYMVAVVFNDKGNNKNYDTGEDGDDNSFKAFYADDCDSSKAVSGKLPPSIGLVVPKEFSHYIRGREFSNLLFQNTYIVGRVDLEVNVQADSGVDKVEYVIEGRRDTDTLTVYDKPYSYTWDSFSFGKFTITAKVYDEKGRTASDSIEVFAFIL